MELQNSKSGSGKILKTVGAISALLTAVAGLIGALTAVGVFDGDRDERSATTVVTEPQRSTEVSQTTSHSTVPAPDTAAGPDTAPPATAAPGQTTPSTQQTEVDPRTAVTLAYAGDAAGCGLDISVDIADRSFRPVGLSFVATDVPVGVQDYQIRGTIGCPFVGQCEASGFGTIDVVAGRVFFVVWENVDFGLCDIALAA